MYILNMSIFILIIIFVFVINFYQYRRTVVRNSLLHWFRVSRELLLLEIASGGSERKLQCEIASLDEFFRGAEKDADLSRSPEFLAVKSARESCLKMAEEFNLSIHRFPGKAVAVIIRAKEYALPADFSTEK